MRGDQAVLAEGDRVPADAVLLECVNFSVDESALTGEAVPVRKTPVEAASVSAEMGRAGGDATPWVFSGTLVVKGHGVALVKQTGAGTELGRIGTALRTIEPEATPLQREVDRLVRYIAVFGLAAAAAVVIIYGVTRGNSQPHLRYRARMLMIASARGRTSPVGAGSPLISITEKGERNR